jgi:hypothetical protein
MLMEMVPKPNAVYGRLQCALLTFDAANEPAK